MKTSIVIITFNRSRRILSLLKSILPLLNDSREIIVIDDGSTDDTAELVQSLTESSSNAKFFTIENRGRAAARNFGARQARGELIIFLDDDIEVSSYFFDRHEFIQNVYIGSWVTGCVHQKIQDLPHSDFLRFRRNLDYKAISNYKDALGIIQVDSFSTQQLSVSAVSFHAVGGFKEDLRDCEDFELSIRVRDSGHQILHDTQNVVMHCDYATFDSFLKRQVEYRKGRNVLMAKIPELQHRFPDFFFRHRKVSAAEKILRRVLTYNVLWREFFQGSIRLRLPESLLYFLYDIVLSSTLLLSSELLDRPIVSDRS